MVREAAFALLLLATATSHKHDPPLILTSLDRDTSNMSLMLVDIAYHDSEEHYTTLDKYYRNKRESHSLIGTFDISKLFKKRNRIKQEEAQASASSLRSKDIHTTLGEAIALSASKDTIDSDRIFYTNETTISTERTTTTPQTTRSTVVSETHFTANIKVTDKPAQTSSVQNKPKTRNKESRKSKSVANTKIKTKNNSKGNDLSKRRETRVINKKKAENDSIWPVKHAAVLEGDIVLGGLMMVHGRASGNSGGSVARCGPLMPQGGVQALEAMLFALDEAERAGLAVPGVKLGALVLDDCDSDTRGLEMALDFIKGSISNIDDEEYACNATAVRKVISGVVGAASSVTSVQVANLLRLFKIPQVSFFSTSPELSNKARFEYFTRTIPSDLHQVRAMVEIVKKFGWRYVSIIYEESNYGIKAFEELETLLLRDDICIAVKERLAKDSGAADENAYDAIVERLLSRPRARGELPL
ncbi:metabotropic glutamate receptor 2-like [Vanessa tameamea]|uniref:Metabotropic glutamate receptor 2-like n=1 Tax=Vanessa tameamea TaxID=334116 RepID=A0ABM4AN58_VANTA